MSLTRVTPQISRKTHGQQFVAVAAKLYGHIVKNWWHVSFKSTGHLMFNFEEYIKNYLQEQPSTLQPYFENCVAYAILSHLPINSFISIFSTSVLSMTQFKTTSRKDVFINASHFFVSEANL